MPLCFFCITEGADDAPSRSVFSQSLFLDSEYEPGPGDSVEGCFSTKRLVLFAIVLPPCVVKAITSNCKHT